jgi:hypothetical protein
MSIASPKEIDSTARVRAPGASLLWTETSWTAKP